MKANVKWNQQMNFTASAGTNQISIDDLRPIGKGEAMTPKQLLLVSMAGCTAMYVMSLMRKYKQNVTSFSVETEADKSEGGHPHVFTKAELIYYLEGGDLDLDKIKESVKLSMTQYCGVSAMLSKAFPIHYKIIVNHEEIDSGQASFDF